METKIADRHSRNAVAPQAAVLREEQKSVLTRVGVGGLAFGGHYGTQQKSDSMRTIRAALEQGIRFFDTSPAYGGGRAETILGDSLGAERYNVTIATRIAAVTDSPFSPERHHATEAVLQQLEESLRRLRRDYVDIYLLDHAHQGPALRDVIETLETLRRDGKIRKIGIVQPDTASLREALKCGRVDVIQHPYNIINRVIDAEILPFCRAARIELHVCEPFSCGLLVGHLHKNSSFDMEDRRVEDKRFRGEQYRKNIELMNRLRPLAYQEGLTLHDLALGWVLQNPLVAVALCGARLPQHIHQMVAATRVRLTPEQIIAVDQIVNGDTGSTRL
jgi:aryl-alcohol dehydrogenase-like predicted oxidoreductase